MSSSPAASVIVCTRNRSTLLDGACRAVLEQRLPGRPWELVLIDNQSTDDTWEVAQRLAAEFPTKVRTYQEQELGLSAARNAGLRLARGDVLVFLDDDAFPEPGWLQAIVETLGEPGVDCVGGPVDPVFRGELPDWFLGRYLPYLSAWDLGDRRRGLVYDEYPRGANLAFRRQALDRAGEFCTALGRKGDNLVSCEEIELCLRIERLGGTIVYEPAARVRHHVNVERLSESWMMRRFEAQGRSEAIINWRHGGLSALLRGTRTMRNRVRAAASQAATSDDLIVRCSRSSFMGYLRSCLTVALVVAKWRWPAGLQPAPWSPHV